MMKNFRGKRIDIKNFPDSVFFFKGEKTLFEIEKSTLWVSYSLMWVVFQDDFKLEYPEIQEFIKSMLEKHFKIKGVTPYRIGSDLNH